MRYYEKELNLKIRRNAQNHRVYSNDNLEMIKTIIHLREQGIELKAIKSKIKELGCDSLEALQEAGVTPMATNISPKNMSEDFEEDFEETELSEAKRDAFLHLIKDTIEVSVKESQEIAKERIKDEIMAKISEELTADIKQDVVGYVDERMSDLQRQVEQYSKQDDEHYKKLDEAIHEMKRMKQELAELGEMNSHAKEKKGIFDVIFGKKQKKESVSESVIM